MIDWLAANWVNILVIALVAVAVFFAARSLIKDKKLSNSISCCCGILCSKKPDQRQESRQELMRLQLR